MNRMPKLRFKEFNIKWEEKKLGDITKFSKGKLISKEDITETGIECIRYGELYTTYGEVITKIVSKTNLNVKDLVLSEKNDIIIPSSGETAIDIAKASCVTKSEVALGGDLNILKLNENGIFLSYYLNNKLKYQIASLAQGASVVHLYENHLKKLKVLFPSLNEQQKIADFLSSVDKKISIIEEKLDLFKDYKKGIMQKIFKQELRFKDSNGNDYPEWEEKRLGDVFSFKQGYQIPFKEQIKIKEKGYVRYLYISDFFSDKNLLYVKDDGKEKITETDITVANTGNTAGSFYRGKSGILSNNMFNIQNDEKVVTNDFLFQFLGTSLYSNQLKTFFNSSGQPHLGHKNMSMIIINYPVSFEEQQKIANFLSSIDKKNDNLATELENLKEFKKGLLQQMFI